MQAVEWWQKGEVEKVRKYCIEDVRITRELYEYALKHGSLKYKELSKNREFKIDTRGWEAAQGEGAGMTYTLGAVRFTFSNTTTYIKDPIAKAAEERRL